MYRATSTSLLWIALTALTLGCSSSAETEATDETEGELNDLKPTKDLSKYVLVSGVTSMDLAVTERTFQGLDVTPDDNGDKVAGPTEQELGIGDPKSTDAFGITCHPSSSGGSSTTYTCTLAVVARAEDVKARGTTDGIDTADVKVRGKLALRIFGALPEPSSSGPVGGPMKRTLENISCSSTPPGPGHKATCVIKGALCTPLKLPDQIGTDENQITEDDAKKMIDELFF